MKETEKAKEKFKEKGEAFLHNLLRKDFWGHGGKARQELLARLKGKIPVLGFIHHEEWQVETAKKTYDQNIQIYLVGSDGQLWQDNQELAFSKNVTQNFIELLAGYLLGNPAEEITVLEDEREIDSNIESLGFFRWKLACVSEAVLSAAYKKSKIRIVADTKIYSESNSLKEWNRFVFPDKFQVKAHSTSEFYLGKEKVRFVRLHEHCAEYVTSDGARVFDHRQGGADPSANIVFWSEKEKEEMEKRDKRDARDIIRRRRENRPIPLWKKALRDWIQAFQPEAIADKKTLFAWHMLCKVANGEIGNNTDDFGQGLAAFTGTRLIPTRELFQNCWYEKRFSCARSHWRGNPYFGENVFNPLYVVITDAKEDRLCRKCGEKAITENNRSDYCLKHEKLANP